MAKSKSGDGFSVDFSDMFSSTAKKDKQQFPNPEKNEEKKNVEERLSIHQQADHYTDISSGKKPESKGLTAENVVDPYNNKHSDEPVKEKIVYCTIYLADEDDHTYLKFRAREKGQSVSDFLWELIQSDDIDRIENVQDNLHQTFRTIRLPVSTSVKMTTHEKKEMKRHAAKHRLMETRFIGYLVRKARLNDPDW